MSESHAQKVNYTEKPKISGLKRSPVLMQISEPPSVITLYLNVLMTEIAAKDGKHESVSAAGHIVLLGRYFLLLPLQCRSVLFLSRVKLLLRR